MVSMQVEMYTDGSCIRNPGTGGLAYIIRYFEQKEDNGVPESKEITFSQGYRLTTNNRMEIMSVLFGMQKVIEIKQQDPTWSQVSQLNIQSDSEYVCKAINQRWIEKWRNNNWMTSGFGGKQPGPVKNKDLWEQISNTIDTLKNYNVLISINWVKGHNGNEMNERCDKMAKEAADGTTFIKDEEYEKITTVYNRR